MLIVALQDGTDNLYSIWDTATDRILGHDLNKSETIEIIRKVNRCDELSAKDMVENPKPYTHVLRHIIARERKFYKLRMPGLRLRWLPR